MSIHLAKHDSCWVLDKFCDRNLFLYGRSRSFKRLRSFKWVSRCLEWVKGRFARFRDLKGIRVRSLERVGRGFKGVVLLGWRVRAPVF